MECLQSDTRENFSFDKINNTDDDDFIDIPKKFEFRNNDINPQGVSIIKEIFKNIGCANLSPRKFEALTSNSSYDILTLKLIDTKKLNSLDSNIFNAFIAPTIFKRQDLYEEYISRLSVTKTNELPDKLFKTIFRHYDQWI